MASRTAAATLTFHNRPALPQSRGRQWSPRSASGWPCPEWPVAGHATRRSVDLQRLEIQGALGVNRLFRTAKPVQVLAPWSGHRSGSPPKLPTLGLCLAYALVLYGKVVAGIALRVGVVQPANHGIYVGHIVVAANPAQTLTTLQSLAYRRCELVTVARRSPELSHRAALRPCALPCPRRRA